MRRHPEEALLVRWVEDHLPLLEGRRERLHFGVPQPPLLGSLVHPPDRDVSRLHTHIHHVPRLLPDRLPQAAAAGADPPINVGAGPQALAIDSNDNVYVANTGGNTVTKITVC